MGIYFKEIRLKDNKSVTENTIKDFRGDFEVCKSMLKDTYENGDETGVMYYEYAESKSGNRITFKATDPCGDGFIQIITRY